MFKLKRILPVLLIVLCMLLVSSAPAQAAQPTYARYGLQKSAAVQTSTALLLPAGTWVYGLEIFAEASSSVRGIYDAATLGTATDDTVVSEIGEATQYDSKTVLFSRPIYFTNGVTVVMSTGVGFVLHGPQP